MPARSGFSLVELLLVLGIIVAISLPGIIAFNKFRENQALVTSAEQLKSLLTQAHIYARESKDDLHWGIERQDQYTYRFKSKLTKAGSPTNVSEYTLEKPISFSTNSFSVWFDKGTGDTTATNIVLKTPSNKTATVNINAAGVVEVGP